jgi:hypothetical protein
MNLKATHEAVAQFERRIRELLAEGVPVAEAVRRAYALYPVMKVMADEVQAQIVAEAVRGYGDALPEGVSDCLFTHSWAPDKLTLSERTTRGGLLVRALVAQAITQQLKKGATYRRTARTIFDGYKKGGLIPEQDLPKFLQDIVEAGRRADIPRAKLLQMLKPVKKEIAKRTTAGMRAAYTQLVRAVEAQNEKALENAIYVATQERTRYFAERIARTEMARAYHDGFLARWDGDENCIAYQWRLSGRHPVYDICDLYAKANLYGLGAGIFPKGKVPLIPAHPNCMCVLKPVIRGMLDNETPHERIEEGGMEYLRSVNPHQRRLLLGVHGARAVMEGKVSWTELARGYGGKKVDSRLSSTSSRGDIIKQSGALEPNSRRAQEHAVRYYESVRHMTADCQRIAANTGFREQDIRVIKSHVFIEEHDLRAGRERFFPDYEMAQSWQRLIDGRDIQKRDIVLLNHEFLEHTLLRQGLSVQEAHEQAQKTYNYAVLARRD